MLFAKNGTDATTVCVTTARAATGRRKLLVARGAYHGAAPWCTPNPAGVTPEDRAHLLHFRYNDIASLEQAAARGRRRPGRRAGVAVPPRLRRRPGTGPARVRPRACVRCATARGAALILDEVRAGARLHLAGSWEPLGVRPDLAAWSKAIANGHALAAVTGSDRFRDAAASIFVTGSFWCGAVAMAASLACLRKLQAVDGIAHMQAMGQRLRDGLAARPRRTAFASARAARRRCRCCCSTTTPKPRSARPSAALALERGVYLHPKHNMFLSVAHRPADIDCALEATDQAFAALAAGRAADSASVHRTDQR